jgi:hypothetical protein
MKNLDNYDPYQTNLYRVSWFQVLTFRETRFVVYGQGQWNGHIMDWAGCNFFHGRVPGSPTFATIEDAVLWLDEQARLGNLKDGMTLSGHHSGENRCLKGCDERQVLDAIHVNNPKYTNARHRKPGVHVYLGNTLYSKEHGGLKLPKRIAEG